MVRKKVSKKKTKLERALEGAKSGERKAEGEEQREDFLCFTLGEEWYGIEAPKVDEIVKLIKVTRIPGTPDYILGVINLRGNIISVIDLKRLFGMGATAPDEKSRILIVKTNEIVTGILADSVSDILSAFLGGIEERLSTLEGVKSEYIKGQAQIKGRLLILLNLENIIEDSRIKGRA